MMKVILLAVAATAWFAAPVTVAADQTPWWEQQKIRFFWGQWRHFSGAGVTDDELMASFSKVGATVFVSDLGSAYDRDPATEEFFKQAVVAKKHGLRCFGKLYVVTLPLIARDLNAPHAVDAEGQSKWTRPDPFFKPAYEAWFKPVMKMAESGLVDGVHIDWEFYMHGASGDSLGEGREVYNDEYFYDFLKQQDVTEDVPVKERRRWLVENNRHQTYLAYLRDLTATLFRELADQVRQIKPDFVFSSYDSFNGNLENGGWRSAGIAAGLHSPQVPYFIVDPRHYWDYGAAPWWDSTYNYHHELGYKHIGGTYDWRLFGGRPDTQISAARWMVENALHTDGFWVWTEREFGTYEWQAFANADRQIKAIENKVGPFLLRGREDTGFVTLVEMSGNPQWDRQIKHRSYHMDEQHLVVVSNTAPFRPSQVRVRFPALLDGSTWTVRDPMLDLYFTSDGISAKWDAAQLHEGIVIPMPKRSDQFLLLSPAEVIDGIDQADLVQPFVDLPLRESFDENPNGEDGLTDISDDDRLLYLKTETLGNRGHHGMWVIGSGIHSASLKTHQSHRLRHGNGNLWSPSWSPDRKKILFIHVAHGRGQVYVMNADGTEVVNLSRNTFCDKQPVWSPDGSRIAFVSDRDCDWEIYVMNADGSDPTRLTHSPGDDASPTWSPDGHLIAFESARDEDINVYLMQADGSSQRPIIKIAGDVLEPAWSPDGRRIAATAPDAQVRALVIADVETGRLTIPPQAYHTWQVESPRWSPDGRLIAAIYNLGNISGITVFNLSPEQSGTQTPPAVMGDAIDHASVTYTHHVATNTTGARADETGSELTDGIKPDNAPEVHIDPGLTFWYDDDAAAPDDPTRWDGAYPKVTFDLGRVYSQLNHVELYYGGFMDSQGPSGMNISFSRNNVTYTEPIRYDSANYPNDLHMAYTTVVQPIDYNASAFRYVKIEFIPTAHPKAGFSFMTLGEMTFDASNETYDEPSEPVAQVPAGVVGVKDKPLEQITHKRLINVNGIRPRAGGDPFTKPGRPSWYAFGSGAPAWIDKQFYGLSWSPDGTRLAFSSDMDTTGAFSVYTITIHAEVAGQPEKVQGSSSAWPQQIMWGTK